KPLPTTHHTIFVSIARQIRPDPTLPFFFSLCPRPPRSTLFPYTTLFRSGSQPMTRFLLPLVLATLMILSAVPRSEAASSEGPARSEEHTSELQSRGHLVCRLLLEKKKSGCRRRSGGASPRAVGAVRDGPR